MAAWAKRKGANCISNRSTFSQQTRTWSPAGCRHSRNKSRALVGRDYAKAWMETRDLVKISSAHSTWDDFATRAIAAKGVAAYSARHHYQAEKHFRLALRLTDQQDYASRSQLRINIALALLKRGFYPSALRYLGLTADLLANNPDLRLEVGRIEILRALIHYEHGSLKRARRIIEHALENKLINSEDQNARALLESILGRINAGDRNYEKAGEFLESASSMWEEIGNPSLVLETLKVLNYITEVEN